VRQQFLGRKPEIHVRVLITVEGGNREAGSSSIS
jgi:hypothetical protein